MGRVMAAREVRVLQGKVSIDKLEVDVVTGLTVTIDAEPQMEGVLKANIHRDTDLTRNYQVCFFNFLACISRKSHNKDILGCLQ